MRTHLLAGSLLIVCAVVYPGCKRDAPTTNAAQPDSPAAESLAIAALPIHLDVGIGDLQLLGMSIDARPDHRSWVVTLYSKVVHKRDPRQQLWVHAYPQGSSDYFIADLVSTTPAADVGRVVKDGFLLKKPGAFNLYAGVMGADGSYGPAYALGWAGVGDPETTEYHDAYRFLQEANDARAAAMADAARRDYPNARIP